MADDAALRESAPSPYFAFSRRKVKGDLAEKPEEGSVRSANPVCSGAFGSSGTPAPKPAGSAAQP